jgi:chemotaxis protein histidine kinase CheA
MGLCVLAAAPLGCDSEPPPEPVEEMPELQLATADAAALARIHPAWGEAERIRRQLGSSPEAERAIQEELAERALSSSGPLELTGAGPEAPDGTGGQMGPAAGEHLEGILGQHYRPSPQDPLAGDGPADEQVEPVRAEPETAEDMRAAAAEGARDIAADYQAEIEAGRAIDPADAEQELERLQQELARQARAAAARARADWQGPERRADPAESTPEPVDEPEQPATEEMSYAVERDLRLREIAGELAAERRSLEQFGETLRRSAERTTPDQPSWDELTTDAPTEGPGLATVGDPLPGERARLVARYVDLLESIDERTRRDAVTLARSSGLDLSFAGGAPDYTPRIAELLARFYGYARTSADRGEDEVREPQTR